VKEVYDDGRLGHVPLATITRVNNGPFASPPAEDPVVDWQLDPSATGGGALVDLGVHLFDVLEWLFGDMEVRHATLESQLDLPYEDTACVQLRSRATGTQATLQCGFFQWEDPPDVTGSLHLHGVAESVDSREFHPDSLVRHAAASALRNTVRRVLGRSPNYFEPTYYYRAHYRALSAFLDAVAAGEEPPVSGAEGRRTLELVEAAYDRAGIDAEAPSATEEVAWQD
jgi:myo-inositol 2-dehydrogenase/D-chiro-inositol 1-dehydrogenase